MKSTFVECKGCEKHWFNGTGLEMCDNDWNCPEHEERHRTKDICTITWHKYPEEKPTEFKKYLITRWTKWRGIFVDADEWIPDYDYFSNAEEIPDAMKVLAWAEMPKPYGEV